MALTEERFEALAASVQMKIFQDLSLAWKENRLPAFLTAIGCAELIPQEAASFWDDSCKEGKIIIFGESSIKEREIYASLESVGILKNRVELRLGYDELKHYNFNNLQYNSAYRLILVGPMPHSTMGKGDFSSTIAKMEHTDGFTKVIRLRSNEQLKITKSNLKAVVREQMEEGYLAA